MEQSLNSLQPDDIHAPLRIRRAMALAILVLVLRVPVSACHAQRVDEALGTEEHSKPEMSREEWLNIVNEAKKRANEAAIERRRHPQLYAPPAEDPDAIATDRVLRDESLERGDIVSTKKGFFIFRGRSGQERRDDDFLPVPAPVGRQ